MHHLLKDATEEQRAAIQHNEGAAFVSAAPGSGKCVVGSTQVSTPEGDIAIQDIPKRFNVGVGGTCTADVYTKDRSGHIIQTQTSNWFPFLDTDTIRVETSKGYNITGTPEHKLWGRKALEPAFRFIRLDDLMPGDMLWRVENQDPGVKVANVTAGGKRKVYDFTVPTHHSFIANGFLNHNTRVITYRCAYLLDQGVDPRAIIGITFTNKAANEMKQRVKTLVDPSLARYVWLSTFHSFCVRLLRVNPPLYRIKRNFQIADESDSKELVTLAMSRVEGVNTKELQHKEGLADPRSVRRWISDQKNQLVGPADAAAKLEDDEHAYRWPRFVKYYQEYTQLLRDSNLLDFDDLIMTTVLGLRRSDEEQQQFGQHLHYLMVDEWQDTNFAQFELVRLLSHVRGNLFVVGDSEQCFPGDTEIQTPDGTKRIDSVEVGDTVVCGSGHGGTTTQTVEKVFNRKYSGELVEVTTQSGRVMRATPEHCVFGRLPENNDGRFYVYMMHKRGVGYRVGRCQSYRSQGNGKSTFGVTMRTKQEGADEAWILQVCDDKQGAALGEALLAAKFGVPQLPFHSSGRGLTLAQEDLETVFHSIDTKKRAEKCLATLGLSIDHPHYVTGNAGGKSRQITHFVMFDTKRRHHTAYLHNSDEDLLDRVAACGLSTEITHRKGKIRWRSRKTTADPDKALQYAEDLTQAVEGSLRKQAKLGVDMTFDFMPIGNVFPGVLLPIADGDTVVADEVVAVRRIPFEGTVYDLSIPEYRNYCAGGILVHNSIYGFRGADSENSERFYKVFQGAKTYFLQTNFRSVPGIAAVANTVIKNNKRQHEKQIVPHKTGGMKPGLIELESREHEARYIVSTIVDMVRMGKATWKDFAIIYRIRSWSRALEDEAVAKNVPHRVVGSRSFYNRKCIKDILSYCRLLVSPSDNAAFTRVYNTPARQIGPANFARFAAVANQYDYSLMKTMRKGLYADVVMAGAKNGFRQLKALYKNLREMGPEAAEPVMRYIIRWSGYQEYADNIRDPDRRAQVLEDLEELCEAAGTFDRGTRKRKRKGVSAFLEHAALMQQDRKDQDDNKVLMMTAHAAKGLEFPNVFVVGAIEGVLPIHPRPENNEPLEPKAIKEHYEEERRVFYVATTRAEERLWITYPVTRFFQGSAQSCNASRFCREAGDTVQFVSMVDPDKDKLRVYQPKTKTKKPARKQRTRGIPDGGANEVMRLRRSKRPEDREARLQELLRRMEDESE